MKRVLKTMSDAKVRTDEERLVALKILSLLEAGRLVPGDRLPAERRFALQVGVSRAHVRDAFQKLEFYGIVKTWPQSGTVLTEHPLSVLKSQIRNILETDSFDFYSLVQSRVLLEAAAIRLCAQNRTEEDLQNMQAALEDFIQNAPGELRDEKDFAFHLAIARGSHNPVLASMLLIITPDVLKYYRSLGACTISAEQVIEEHRSMLECIQQSNANEAEKRLLEHFNPITAFAQEVKGKDSFIIPRTRI